ncbi:MAG: hypothetical protein WAM14_04530 [Candidatus Nitrosopolaris sp.]
MVFLGNPFFAIATSASLVGGLLGFGLNRAFDFLTSRMKERHEFATHISKQIEENLQGYFLMSNYACLLSESLNRYVQAKRSLQLDPVDPDSPTDIIKSLDRLVEGTAKDYFFKMGFIYRVITDHFWVKGGSYFLPDYWASQGTDDLHNNLMKYFTFDEDIILKYINSTKIESYQFTEKLEKEKNDDLHQEYVKYKQWLLEDAQIKDAAAASFAYCDLISQQLNRLYKRNGLRDPRKVPEIRKLLKAKGFLNPFMAIRERTSNTTLSKVTAELLNQSSEERLRNEAARNRDTDETSGKTEVIDSNALLKVGWGYYINGQYDLAKNEYEAAIEKQDSATTNMTTDIKCCIYTDR